MPGHAIAAAPGRPALMAAAGLALLLGCASQHQATAPLAPEVLAELRAGVDGKKAVVRYTPGGIGQLAAVPRVMVGEVHVGPERLLIVDDEREVPVAYARIEEIDAHHPVRGGIKGGGIGLVAGLLVGILVGSIFEDSCPDGRDRCASHPAPTAVIGVAAGLFGVAVGAPIGAIGGAGPVWRFTPVDGAP